MQIQFNSDESVDSHEAMARHVEEVVRKAMHRFGDHVTRVEAHLSGVNDPKLGDDAKRMVLEARVAGHQPVAVSDDAGSAHQALDGAVQKLKRALDSTLGKVIDLRRTALPPETVE